MRATKVWFYHLPTVGIEDEPFVERSFRLLLEWALQIEESFLRHDVIMLVGEILSKPENDQPTSEVGP